jgi:hypothetical protein
MAVYIQHGHGKADKITTALDDGAVGGVIFGARNEKRDNLRAYIAEIRDDHKGCELLFDPQFYVSTLTPANDRYLPEYPYYKPGRSAGDFTGAKRIRGYAEDTLKFQADLGVSMLLSPTVIFDSFSDRWHQIALNLADASLEYHAGLSAPPPLLLSFVLAEGAMAVAGEVNRFLDAVTQDDWRAEGFYFIIDRTEKTYNQRFGPSRLAQYLYLVYVLSQLNGLRVLCGYTDFVGIPLRAAGAEVFATGWDQSLRQFHRSNFLNRRPGGQSARLRYSSSPLMNSIFLGELQNIFEVGELKSVLSGVPLDEQIDSAANPESANWTKELSQRHHWQTLGLMDKSLTGRVRSDMLKTVGLLRDANELYKYLEASGVQFDPNTRRDHIEGWLRGIDEFQRMAGLA